ncbi:hypothetical protein ACFX13_040339 [Malus domestica]|uniref:Uncharacterized protein n=1 Tax=Malus domestica TaxID=3750 RepID=A0A498JEK9_MALDO|nr:hypothetical protein DVH24_016195 [Malus domestica]
MGLVMSCCIKPEEPEGSRINEGYGLTEMGLKKPKEVASMKEWVPKEVWNDSSIFFHKVSCKLLDSLAKLKLSFNNNHKGKLFPPQLIFVSNNLSVHHNFEDQSTLLKGFVDVGPKLHLRTTHHRQSQEGETTKSKRKGRLLTITKAPAIAYFK